MLGISLSEAELELIEYASVNALFTRRLRPGSRPLPQDPQTVISPVDGILGACGVVAQGQLLQVKGRWYSAAELVDDEQRAQRYEGGMFLTLYLSPRHYHRIHAPAAGAIPCARHVPGRLLPVNRPSLLLTPELFARNERLVCWLDTGVGSIAVVAVGAFNVGRITAAFDRGTPALVTNRRGARRCSREYSPPPNVSQGDELMTFNLGSTVVVLLPPGPLQLEQGLSEGDEVVLGQVLARVGVGAG